MLSRLTIYSLFLALLFISGCREKPTASASSTPATGVASTTAAPVVLEVTTAPVIERELPRAIEVNGTLEGQEEITVSSEVEGTIDSVFFDLGGYVKAGDQLVTLDRRELELRVKQAEAAVAGAEAYVGPVGGPSSKPENHPTIRTANAELVQTKADYERAQRLLESGDIARQDFDRAKSHFDQARAKLDSGYSQLAIYEANLSQARNQLNLARKQLADAVIKAPISGAIKERLVGKGEYLTKGKNVARIVQIDTLRLRGNVPEQYINDLKTGQAVDFKVESAPTADFHGILTRFSPSVDKTSRSLTVEAAIQNQQHQLKPGMFVRAVINTGSKGSSLMVPQRAMITTAGVTKLYIYLDGQARAHDVKIGQREGDMIEILDGVKSGDLIITNNTDKIADGSPVKRQTN